MDRRLAAILAADIAGYSRLMNESEEDTQQKLHVYLDKIREFAERHRGRVFGTFGDAIVVEFSSPVESVRSAIEIQQHLHELNTPLPPEKRMLIRIGINLGDVLVENDNLYGDGVNIAARLENLAPPGGIAVSEEIFRQVNKKLDCGFEDRGKVTLKNIAEPVHVYFVDREGHAQSSRGPASLMRYMPRGRSLRMFLALALATVLPGLYFVDQMRLKDELGGSDKISVAVLPIKNLSADPGQQYISDGFTNDIITDLSKFDELYVPSSHSSFFFEGKEEPLEEIAAALRVRYILEGSVQTENKSLRINAQLIDVKSGNHVWADRYSYPDASDLFAIQDSIVDEVVNKIVVNINPEKLKLVTHSVRTSDMNAQELYWQGVKTFGEQCETKDACDKSRSLFEQALAEDPNFARAHGWLAYVIAQGWYFGFYDASELPLAEKHALKAVALDGSDFENFWSLGEVQQRMGSMDAAAASYQQAIKLNGNDANLLANWAEFLNKRGERQQALDSIDEAIVLSPVDTPDYFYWDKAYILFFMKEHDGALATMERMKKKPVWSGALMAANFARLGNIAEAQKEMTMFLAATDEGTAWTLSSEYDTEASTFSQRDDAVYWLGALKIAGMPPGDKLPADIAGELQ